MGLCKDASATSGSPARTATEATNSQRQPPHPHSRAPHLALAREGRSTAGRGHQAGSGAGQPAWGPDPCREPRTCPGAVFARATGCHVATPSRRSPRRVNA
eukprot:8604111-Alexandrium_andersonii.AAC.1